MDKTSDWLKDIANFTDKQINVCNVCHLIETKQISIETIVTDLCPLLTNTNTEDRTKGLLILSTILSSLPKSYLSLKEVEHLTTFYCDRLKDHYSVVPNVLTGFLAIINCENFKTNLSPIIFNGLVKELSVQHYSVSQRFLVFKLLTQLFERSAKDFQSIRSDFIYGLIQLIEGERDPRCLLLIFRLTHSVVNVLELDPFAEDLFEVISCYFPVLFTPPPDDEYGITKEELSEALNQCLSSSSAFSEFVFPMILEKLESELMTAKIDSFKLLVNICPNYGFDKIKAHINQLWTAIRIDTLKPKVLQNEVSEFALKALTSISDSIASTQKEFNSFVELIWNDILNALNRPELDLMEAAIDIILAVISTNFYAFNKFTEKLIPLLLKQFTFSQKELIHIQIIDSLSKTLEFSQKLSQKPKDLVYSESLFTLLTSLAVAETKSEDLRDSVIKCLKSLIGSMQMTANHWSEISKIFHTLFENYFNCENLLLNAYYLLESIASINPEFVQSITRHMIGIIDSEQKTEIERNRLVCVIKAFPFISSDVKSFESIVLHSVLRIKSNTYSIDTNEKIYSLHLMDGLTKSICKRINSNSEESVKSFLFEDFMDPMIQHCIHVSICTDNKSGTSVNMELMNGLMAIIGKIGSRLSFKYGQRLFEKLSKFSTLGAVDQLLPSVPPTCFCSYQIGPQFLGTLNGSQALIVFRLVFELIANLKYDVNQKDSSELFDKLLDFAINDRFDNQEICVLTSKSIGVFVNRFDHKNEVLNDKLREALNLFNNRLSDYQMSSESQVLIIDVLVWMTKGLVINKHWMRKDFIDLLIKLCENNNQTIRLKASKSFETIHKSEENCLNGDNNANVTILYNQRFYFETLDTLLESYLKHKSSDSDKAQTFLTALLTQLNYITKAVFRIELKRLLPMLLDAINSDASESNQRAALDAISQILIDKNEQILNPSLKSCASNCVMLSINSTHLTVRRSALNCLAQIADTFEESELHYLRDQIVRDLRKTLNDRKRVVRKSAVRARCKWILVGQPGK